MRLFVLTALLVCPVAASPTRAQFTTAVDVVEVYASVLDRNGRPIEGLARDAFELEEDGVRQTIEVFTAGEFPFTAGLAIDRSWSMAGRPLALAKAAASEFVSDLRQGDAAAVFALSDELEVTVPFTGDRDALRRGLAGLDPWSSTALNDGILGAIDLLQPRAGRRALVLLSDGKDRYSHATEVDVLSKVRAADVMIFPVALAKERPALFVELAVLTGGRSFQATDPSQLPRIYRGILDELRKQYLLGYRPTRPVAQGGWRSIRVRVRQPGAEVRARDGYFAR